MQHTHSFCRIPVTQGEPARQVSNGRLQPRAEPARGNLLAPLGFGLPTARRTSQSMSPILGDFRRRGRYLGCLMARGLWVITLQTTPTLATPQRAQLNHVVNFFHRLERAPRPLMPDLRTLFLAARLAA